MDNKLFVYFVSFLAVVAISCSSNSPYEPQIEPGVTSQKLAKFSKIQEIVFNQSCALSGCHAGGNPVADLNLEAGQSYGQLVDVDSRENPQMKRVDPGDPDNSLLIKKLTGQGSTLMPPGGPPISPALVDSIRQWIALGAPNN